MLVLAALSAVAALPAPGARSADVERDALLARGGEVFQANCAACHGTRGEGGPGVGLAGAPPIVGLDVAYVDLTVRTGRMPIAAPELGVYAERLGTAEREALVAYTVDRFELEGEIPTVRAGSPSRGQELYVRNCAACHGAAAGGGISGANVQVPPLLGLDGIAIVEATRVGPFEMPAFDAAVLSDEDLDDIVGYLALAESTPRTAIGLREVDQVVGGLLALGLGVLAGAVLLVVARARRWYRLEPGGYHEDPPFGSSR